MIPKEILKQVRYIEIRTKKLVNEFFGGEYLSVFKGQGMEFANVRAYTYGDDIRTIDWNVTARTGTPQVKQFIEEREMAVFFLVDVSASLHFGSVGRTKSQIAAELSSILAFSAIANNDKVGLIMFSDKVEKCIPLKKGKQHVLRVIREILCAEPVTTKTNLSVACEFTHKLLTRRAVVFVISDFIDSGFDRSLQLLSQYHDVIAIHMVDPRERALPNVGRIMLRDPESGDSLLLSTGSKKMREQFMRNREAEDKELIKKLTGYGIDSITIDTAQPYIRPLMEFFSVRMKRKARR